MIADIAFCHKSSLKKENNHKKVQPIRMGSKNKTLSGGTKSKVVNTHKEKTKEFKANK